MQTGTIRRNSTHRRHSAFDQAGNPQSGFFSYSEKQRQALVAGAGRDHQDDPVNCGRRLSEALSKFLQLTVGQVGVAAKTPRRPGKRLVRQHLPVVIVTLTGVQPRLGGRLAPEAYAALVNQRHARLIEQHSLRGGAHQRRAVYFQGDQRHAGCLRLNRPAGAGSADRHSSLPFRTPGAPAAIEVDGPGT